MAIAGSRNRPTVVVGESNFVTARLLVAALQNGGYTAVAGTTGEHVVALIEKHAASVLVLNLNLLQPSGLELLRILRNRPARLRILAAMSAGQADMRPIATSLGVGGFFELPFAPAALTEQLHNLVEQRHATR
jgi:DNA-binding NtrC family response regulator